LSIGLNKLERLSLGNSVFDAVNCAVGPGGLVSIANNLKSLIQLNYSKEFVNEGYDKLDLEAVRTIVSRMLQLEVLGLRNFPYDSVLTDMTEEMLRTMLRLVSCSLITLSLSWIWLT